MSKTVSLSILDRIQIASPCTVAWDSMSGDDRSRFCGECRLNVYNIAALTRQEAEALIVEKEGKLCARLFRRADGTVLTRDCPVGVRALRAKAAAGLARVGAACAVLIGTTFTVAGARETGARLRQIQPFATLCRWLSPAAQPPMPGKVIMTSGLVIERPVPSRPSGGAAGSQ